jgi:hypothetical protein
MYPSWKLQYKKVLRPAADNASSRAAILVLAKVGIRPDVW